LASYFSKDIKKACKPMPFDTFHPPAKRIAVIGAGISGMSAAYFLAPHHKVTLFETAPRLGGHARTVLAGKSGDQPVDTGFIVFNYANYPHLTRLFHDLDVPVTKSDMSFGASIDGGRIEYGLNTLAAVIGQKRNLLRPQFYGMLRDILRFNARAEAAADDPSQTIGDLMQGLGLGDWFRRYYLMPVCGAIWSTPPDQILDFPAQSLVQFFRNHALLSHKNQHQWWTVDGGSIEYVKRLEARLGLLGVDIRKSSPIQSVLRNDSGCQVAPQNRQAEGFDEVIFACHADQALRMIGQPTTNETQVLGAMRFQDNLMVLHADTAQMPQRRACWSSWVYKADTSRPQTAIGVTYWMNRLQNIAPSDPLFISLNPTRPVDQSLIYDQTSFRHPVFDHAAIAAQGRIGEIQGASRFWFAGAYTRHGFHEDGIASAHRIARLMAIKVAA
jgi:predicted NAD/FAD-binding protein